MPLITTIADVTGKTLFSQQTYTNTSYFTNITSSTTSGVNSLTYKKIPVDAAGNIYIAGQTNASTPVPFLEVIGPTGAQLSIRGETTPATSQYFSQPAVDVLGNFYAWDAQASITKWNAAGTIQYRQTYSLGSTTPDTQPTAVDYAGNLYVMSSTPNSMNTIKYSAAGAISWQRVLTVGGTLTGYVNLALDTVGNIYQLAYSKSGTQTTAPVTTWIYKREPNAGTITGNILAYQITNYPLQPQSMTVDASGNYYVLHASYAIFTPSYLIAKITPAGSITYVTYNARYGGLSPTIMVDNIGNVIVADSNGGYGRIDRFDNNLNFAWSRIVTDQGPSTSLTAIGLHPSGDILMHGNYTTINATTPIQNCFVLRVPPNGTKVGTYLLGTVALGQQITYGVELNTTISSTGTFTATVQTASDAAGTATTAATANANSTSTASSTVLIF